MKEVQTLLQANSDNFSLNAELDDESHTELADVIEQTTIPSAEDEMQEQSRREELLAHMSELSPKERLVLTLRHGVTDNVPKRIDELAAFLNRERENVAAVLATRDGQSLRDAGDHRRASSRSCCSTRTRTRRRGGASGTSSATSPKG